MLRTDTCGELRKEHAEKKVKLAGWVNAIRDHGNLIFIDLRDRYGITQVLFDPEKVKLAYEIKPEYVVLIEGTVKIRPGKQIQKFQQEKLK